VARALLGALLVRRDGRDFLAARITETEAYLGIDDPACHSFRGRRTPRNEVMWGRAGHLYVYFTYGMHHCANVVTRLAGVPEAVLLRGALAVAGEEAITARRGGRTGGTLLAGPARLCQGLGLDLRHNGLDLTAAGDLFLASDGLAVEAGEVRVSSRVGVAYAGEAASWPLRFALAPGARR
jgi:DNA-3-methyladenine glycosylase